MKTSKIIFNRIYSDYFLPSRMDEYRELLRTLLQSGHEFYGIGSYMRLDKDHRGPAEADKYLVLRHDIDSDVKTAKEMWAIEKELGISSSYFFRLSTIDIPLMQEIHRSGGDVGYHYEEIATYAKEHGLKTMEDVQNNMKNIQTLFQHNIANVRQRTGLALTIAASHGDFMNRKIGVTNTELLKDRSFRSSMGIELEAYDEEYRTTIGKFISDDAYPNFWKPSNPLAGAILEHKTMQILIHPGNWQSTVYDHTYHNLNRLYEACRYQWICGNNVISQHIKRVLRSR